MVQSDEKEKAFVDDSLLTYDRSCSYFGHEFQCLVPSLTLFYRYSFEWFAF